ncbi:hypothetical protein ZWY2020_022915 [Hordeum vulgare]|nr:hypothetical protein ZWY2020_022915 [Hordeum vulgare]
MEGMWRKAKRAMGIGICAHLLAVTGDRDDCASERRASDAFSEDSAALGRRPRTPARGIGLPAMTSNTKVILNGFQKVTFARPDGYFAFHNVPAGTHLIEVSSLGFFFSPVRVDISARNPGHIQAALTENRRVLNELVLEPLKEEQYYEMREPFNILSLLKSPMGMMVGFMVVMVFVMPKMMENIAGVDQADLTLTVEVVKEDSGSGRADLLASTMAGLTSDSDDSDKFEWESDGEAAPSSAPAMRNLDAPGLSTLVPQDSNGWTNREATSNSLVEEYVRMGFPKEMVVKGIKEIGHNDANALLELLLTYKALGDEGALGNCSTSGCSRPNVEDDNDDDLDFDNWNNDQDTGGRQQNSDSSGDENFLKEMSAKDEKISSLVYMGFSEDEANMAMTRCGVDADLWVLVDSITASQVAGDCRSRNVFDHQVMDRCFDSFGERKKARLMEERKKKRMRYGEDDIPSAVTPSGSARSAFFSTELHCSGSCN